MKVRHGSNPGGRQKPEYIIHLIAIGLLLMAALIVTEIWEYYDSQKHLLISARREAKRDAEYLRDTILKLILSSEKGGAMIHSYIDALNTKHENYVRLIHSEAIDAQYGVEPDEFPVNEEEKLSLMDGEPRGWETEDYFISLSVFKAIKECQACHHLPGKPDEPIPVGYIIGLLEVTHPKTEMKQAQSNLLTHTARGIGLTIFVVLMFVYGIYRLMVVLRESEQRITAIIRTVGEGIIVIGQDSLIRFLNHEACDTFGYPEEELLGKDIEILVPEKYKKQHKEGMERYLKNGETNIMGRRIELEGVRKDGTAFPLEIRLEETIIGSRSRFVTAAIRDVTQRKQAQKALEHFSRKLVESQENERKRIAAELHDSLGQNLLTIRNGIKQYLSSSSLESESSKDLDQIAELAIESINDLREISFNLHPHQLDQLGLKTAIESMIEQAAHSSGISVSSDIFDIDGQFPKDMEINIYRMIQEGLNNIVKYSGAKKAEVSVKKTGKHVNIKIADYGKGFDTLLEGPGFGLKSINERVKMMQGSFEIDSAPGKGAEIKIKVPVKEDGRSKGI